MRLLNEFSEVTLAPLRDTMRRLMLEVYALCFDEDESRDVECAFPIKRDPSKIIEYHQRGYVNFDAVVRTLTQSENLGPTDFHQGGDTPPNPPGIAKGDHRRGNGKGDDREGVPPKFEKKRELSSPRRGHDEENENDDDDDDDDDEVEEERERKAKTDKRKRKGEGASSGSSSSSGGSRGSKRSKGSEETTSEDSADSGNGSVKKKKRKRRRKKKKSVSG